MTRDEGAMTDAQIDALMPDPSERTEEWEYAFSKEQVRATVRVALATQAAAEPDFDRAWEEMGRSHAAIQLARSLGYEWKGGRWQASAPQVVEPSAAEAEIMKLVTECVYAVQALVQLGSIEDHDRRAARVMAADHALRYRLHQALQASAPSVQVVPTRAMTRDEAVALACKHGPATWFHQPAGWVIDAILEASAWPAAPLSASGSPPSAPTDTPAAGAQGLPSPGTGT